LVKAISKLTKFPKTFLALKHLLFELFPSRLGDFAWVKLRRWTGPELEVEEGAKMMKIFPKLIPSSKETTDSQ
jgi:hypothetical protein